MTTINNRPGIHSRLSQIGTLRKLLLISVAVVIVAAPFADGQTHMHDWRLLPSVVAPSVMMMLVFALPLDITMARIFMADADVSERERLRFAIRAEVFAYLAMLATWSPFLINVLEISPFE